MDEPQYKTILAELSQRTKAATSSEAFEEYIDLHKAVQQWYESGALGAIPFEDRLQELGILTPQTMPLTTGVASPLTDAANHRQTSTHSAISSIDGAVPPSTTSSLVPISDPDDYLQERFDEALAALNKRLYATAVNLFGELQELVQGRLIVDVNRFYAAANDQLGKEIQRAIDNAKKVEKSAPNDLKQRRIRWTAVQSLQPENDEARAALEQIQRDEAAKNITTKIDEISGKLKVYKNKKVGNDDLQDVNAFVSEIERLESISTPSETLTTLKSEVLSVRDKIRAYLGQASTLSASGDLKAAYITARGQMDAGILEVIDFQQGGVFVPTAQFFNQARILLLSAKRQLAAERQQRAEEQKDRGYPDAGKLVLLEARALLQDADLSDDDRAALEPQVETIDNAIKDIELELAKYKQAQILISDSNKVPTPNQKLELLLRARQEYPRHPLIAQEIANAEDGLAGVEASQLQQKLEEALLKLERDKYAEARVLVQNAREGTANQFAIYLTTHPASDNPPNLAQRLREADSLIAVIGEKESTHERLMQKVHEIQAAFQKFDAGEPHQLAEVVERLESLTDEETAHRDVQEIVRQLARRQGHQANWDKGEQEYRRQNWAEAQTFFGALAQSVSTQRAKAALWAKRAEAMLLAKEAADAYGRSDWAASRSIYSQVQALLLETGVESDPNTYTLERTLTTTKEVLAELAHLEAADKLVKKALLNAKVTFDAARFASKAAGWQITMDPILEFKQAYDLIEAAKAERSTLRQELDTVGLDIRNEWHKAYLGTIQSHEHSDEIDVLDRAVKLADEAHANNLLWKAEERTLVNQLRARRLDVQFSELRRRQQWIEAETNRKARMEINVGNREVVEQEYREVLRKRVRNNVDQDLRTDEATALPKLKEQLRHPDLVGDADLLAYAVELSWRGSDWTEAERFAGRIEALPGQATRGRVWRRLTKIAANFREATQSAISDLEALAKDADVNKDQYLLSLVQTKQDEFIARQLDQLIEEGRTQSRQKSEDSLIKAALAYSAALSLKNDDRRASDGLQEIGSQLKPGLEARCEQARNLSITTAHSLDRTLAQARDLLTQLEAIHQVASALRLDDNLKAELEETVAVLTKRSNIWAQVKTGLVNARREVEKAQQSPSREAGWEFKTALGSLTGAERNVPNEERTCREMIKEETRKVKELEEQGVQLFATIQTFMQYVFDEAFDKALAYIPTVTTSLTKAGGSDKWGGLDLLFQHDYRYFGARRDVRSLDEHRAKLTESERNFNDWRQWADGVRERQASADGYAKRLQRGFDTLREREQMALETISKLCRELHTACDELEDQITTKPNVPVLSDRAHEAEKSAVAETIETLIKGHRGIADRIQKEAQTKRDGLKQEMGPLRQLIGQLESQRRRVEEAKTKLKLPFQREVEVSRQTINSAVSFFEKCRSIDPYDPEVMKYEEQLRDWKYLK